MNTHRKTLTLILGVLAVVTSHVYSAARGGVPATAPDNAPRSIAPYFTPATSLPKAPDTDGFLQRWLLLEPITKPNRTNTVFTDSYVRNAFATEYFPDQFTVVPRNGDKVTVAGQELGSNSASMWWLNGKEAVILSGDRRMVMDDGISKRLTLNKGRNVIRGAVINGPGLSDFCVRFIDENGKPIKELAQSLEKTENQ
jgi:hypothetical protein